MEAQVWCCVELVMCFTAALLYDAGQLRCRGACVSHSPAHLDMYTAGLLLFEKACAAWLQVNYAAGEPVWSEKEGGDLFYIIKEGAALLKDAASGAVLSKLGPGAHFGQQSLLGPGERLSKL